MTYFRKFPLFVTSNYYKKSVIVTDIFQRIAVENRFQDVSAVLLPYIVLDGETPDIVANKIYGNPLYHWVVLHANNIVNPYLEWPLLNSHVELLVFDKYPFLVTVAEEDVEKFVIGETVQVTPENNSYEVVDVIGTTVYLKSLTVGVTYITVDGKLQTPDYQNINILQVSDPRETPHHYIDTDTGLVVDFDISNPAIEPVSNLDFELSINDDKRTIQLLDPKFLQTFERQFNSLLTT